MADDKPKVVVLSRAPGEARSKVVELLEEALALAKAGKIVAVGVAMVEPDHGTATSMWSDRPAAPLIAATSILHHRAVHEHTYGGGGRPWFDTGLRPDG